MDELRGGPHSQTLLPRTGEDRLGGGGQVVVVMVLALALALVLVLVLVLALGVSRCCAADLPGPATVGAKAGQAARHTDTAVSRRDGRKCSPVEALGQHHGFLGTEAVFP